MSEELNKFDKIYDAIISIGQDCSVAGGLVLLNYRNYSLPFDWCGSWMLFVNKMFSHGLEINIDYKNSTTIRLLYNNIYEAEFKHNGEIYNNLRSYGFGLRIKSILGPLNFMWTTTNNPIYNGKQNNYFFNLGFNY